MFKSTSASYPEYMGASVTSCVAAGRSPFGNLSMATAGLASLAEEAPA